MKLRWYDRILISLGGLVLAAAGVLLSLAAGGVVEVTDAVGATGWFSQNWQAAPPFFIAGILLFALGVWQIVRPFLRARDQSGRYYTVQDGGEDGVHISVSALEHLVYKAVGAWPEILTARVKIGGQETAMRITLYATLAPDVKIPELIRDAREEVRAYIESCAGVKVESVKVIIDATKEGKGKPREAHMAAKPETTPFRALSAAPQPASIEPAVPPEPPKPQGAWQEPKQAPLVPHDDFKPVVLAPTEPAPIAPAEPEPFAFERAQDEFIPLMVQLSKTAFPFPEEPETAAMEQETMREEAQDA